MFCNKKWRRYKYLQIHGSDYMLIPTTLFPSLQSPTKYSGIWPSFLAMARNPRAATESEPHSYGLPTECAVTKEEKLPGFLRIRNLKTKVFRVLASAMTSQRIFDLISKMLLKRQPCHPGSHRHCCCCDEKLKFSKADYELSASKQKTDQEALRR